VPKARRADGKHREYSAIQVLGVVDTIRNLSERIAWRCAELGITHKELALRMGRNGKAHHDELRTITRQKSIGAARFARLLAALEWPDAAPLHVPLPTLQGETQRILRKWKKVIASENQGARNPEPIKRGRK
jgi:hypothetical protein